MAERLGFLSNFGWNHRPAEATAEHQRLLPDAEQAEEDQCFVPSWLSSEPCAPDPYAHLPVYANIHRIRQYVIAAIDDPYSLEQLRSPRMNVSVVRPLVDRLEKMEDVSIVYCLLVNRVQFLREQTHQPHNQTVSNSRATLCEMVANKMLRRLDEDVPGPKGLLLLANVMVAGFEPFQNAPEEIARENSNAFHWMVQKRGGYEKKLTSLEIAIISKSRLLLSSPSCQKVVDGIYNGRIVYTPSSFIDILPDHYKHRLISLYDPRKAPLLNQYRLVIPRTRNFLEICQFVILLGLYFLVMETRIGIQFTIYEFAFFVYAFGWQLEQLASMLEHGWEVYTQNLWSFLDVIFAVIYAVYLVLRIHGVVDDNDWSSHQALDVLSTAAPILIPRLAFNLMSENMLFLSLRAMMANFAVLSLLTVWCFGGFFLAMMWLEDNNHPSITIAKWMLWVWFGLDGTGIQKSVDFHRLLGPILMVTFTFLGNTLFLTILVSMLSNTFSKIVNNATEEIAFRRAVSTFEGVKSDAIFAYQPPFNILALCIMLPLKFVVSPRWFHKVNVAIVRTINAPLLLAIGAYERRTLWNVISPRLQGSVKAQSKLALWNAVEPKIHGPFKARSLLALLGFQRFSVHGDIQAVFDFEPPQSILEQTADADELRDIAVHGEHSAFHPGHAQERLHDKVQGARGRKDSMEAWHGVGDHLPDILSHFSGGGKTQERLTALEESNKRIEGMLSKLCANLDDSSSDGHTE